MQFDLLTIFGAKAITDHNSTNRESPSISFLHAYLGVKNDLSFHSSDIADQKILQFNLLIIFGAKTQQRDLISIWDLEKRRTS